MCVCVFVCVCVCVRERERERDVCVCVLCLRENSFDMLTLLSSRPITIFTANIIRWQGNKPEAQEPNCNRSYESKSIELKTRFNWKPMPSIWS